jgi:nitroreductase
VSNASTNKTAAAESNAIDTLEELLGARYSCRAYKPDPVPRATIERLLTVAQRTASWCNSQPWQVKTGADAVTDFPWPREYVGVYLERRRESGFQLYNALGIARGDKAAYNKQALENFKFFGAPHVAIITTSEPLGVYGAVDCGGYVSNFMLAAQALGLGSIAQAALARRADVIREHFSLGADRNIVCGISFGYPDHDHVINSYRTSRASPADTARFVGE